MNPEQIERNMYMMDAYCQAVYGESLFVREKRIEDEFKAEVERIKKEGTADDNKNKIRDC